MSTPLFKILIFLKRRSGMSSIAFRDYYEGVHSKFGEKYADGLHRYLRRYVEPLADALLSHSEALDFDVIIELWFTERAAFDLVVKYAAQSRLAPAELHDDAGTIQEKRAAW